MQSTSSTISPPSVSTPPVINECDTDSLSHIFSFLTNKEFRSVLRVNQRWNHVAQLKSAWPKFDTTNYIRQLIASPGVEPHFRSFTVNLATLGHVHLTSTSNSEYLTKRAEYVKKHNESPDDLLDRSKIHALTTRTFDKKSEMQGIFRTATKSGNTILASEGEKMMQVYLPAQMIEFIGCNNKELLDRFISDFSALRAIRIRAHEMNRFHRFRSTHSDRCSRVEVLEMQAYEDTAMSMEKLNQFPLLRVLRIDSIVDVKELIQLHQLEYLKVENFTFEVARAVRYLSVKHCLRSFALVIVKVSSWESDAIREEAKRALDALTHTEWNDMRETDVTCQTPLDDVALHNLPPADLTHLDIGNTGVFAGAFVSICRLMSLRRVRVSCNSIGSLAHLSVAKRFLGQLESFDTESLHKVTIDRLTNLCELKIVDNIAYSGLLHINQLRELHVNTRFLTSMSGKQIQLPSQLERLIVQDHNIEENGATERLDMIASLVAPLSQFHLLTVSTCAIESITSRTLALISQSSTWSTLKIERHKVDHNYKRDRWKPVRPEEVHNIDLSQQHLGESTTVNTLSDRVRRSFRLHLAQFELIYRIRTNTETGEAEWKLDNQ